MKKGMDIIGSAMKYSRIMLLLVGLMVALGIYGLIHIPKQEFPEYTIRQGVVIAVYPGATSADVETKVAKPLERYLYTYGEINRERSYSMSRDGVLIFMVEFNDEVDNKNEIWSKIKLGLQEFKMSLPKEVVALIASDDFGDTSALLISIESDDKTYRELKEYVDALEEKLMRLPDVSNIRTYGIIDEEIRIDIDRSRLAQYGLDIRMLMAKMAYDNLNLSMASVKNDSYSSSLFYSSDMTSEQEISDYIVYVDDRANVVKLSDIARITRTSPQDVPYIENNGNRSVILSMEMKPGRNIVDYGREVDQVLGEFAETLPESVHIERIADQPKIVEISVHSFVRDLFISIAVVILVMMLLFPFRSAVVAATSIPISIFISIAVMYFCGIPLNTVTLAALIASLGMIVDNSIIVVDAYLEKIDTGMSRWHAAVSSAKEFFWSIFLATTCICVIFFPLLLTMKGIVFDFLEMFPWTLTITLTSSLVVAMIFIPFMEFVVIRKGLHSGSRRKKFDFLGMVQRGYERLLKLTFRFPYTTLLFSVAAIVAGAIILLNLKQRMLPYADRAQFAVEIYLPGGTVLSRTEEVCDSLYRVLSKDERITSITSFVGQSSPRFQATYAPQIAGSNYAQFIVNTVSEKATVAVIDDYEGIYKDHFPDAFVKFKQLDYQVAAAPLEVRLSSESIPDLKRVADSIMSCMREMEGLDWIRTNYENPVPALSVKLNGDEASRLSVNPALVASELSVLYGGIQVGTVWEGDHAVPVKLMSSPVEGSLDESLSKEYIATGIPGVTVPVRQIAEIEPIWNQGQIVRRNGMRTISVMAEIDRQANVPQLQKQLEQVVEDRILPDLPEGMIVSYGGEQEINAQLMTPIVKGVTISVIIVFMFLLFNFKKMSLVLASLYSIFFSLIGASVGLLISGHDLSITCILGIVSLIGVVVRNAIIMFEYAQELRLKYRFTPRDAAYTAGKRRMLPIFLTSATTAAGVIPMMVTNSSLWGSMGVVIFSGTIFCTFLVVSVLPVMYWKICREK